VTTIIKKKASLNHRDDFGWTALHYAARQGSTKIVRILTKASADPNLLTGSGRSALHFLASIVNQPKTKEQAALEDAIRVRGQQSLRTCALALSPLRPFLTLMIDSLHTQGLLAIGADPNQKDENGITPLFEATRVGSAPTLSFFLKNDGDVHRRNKYPSLSLLSADRALVCCYLLY